MSKLSLCNNDESLYIQGDPNISSERASLGITFIPCHGEKNKDECASEKEIATY